MQQGQLYGLADSTVAEPLVNKWSAWAHLISPVPASLHLLNYQIKTMRSYLSRPEFHFKASHDPKLVGGPFVDVPPDRADEIRELLKQTEHELADCIELAKTVVEFHTWLVDEAKGQSLEPYYQKIPEPLRGYVELVYDYYHRPSIRFLEPLLYESPYYKPELQSLRLSRLDRDDSRPFFMSTPRLPQAEQLDWPIAFDDPRLDAFFGLDTQPMRLGQIADLLDLSAEQAAQLLPLLSPQVKAVARRWAGDGVRLKYFGHACVMVEWQDNCILTDPFIAAVPGQAAVERFSYADLPEKIDYVLITHNHQDHFALESLLRLRGRIECLVVPRSYGYLYGDVSLKKMARRLGFKQVEELDTLESIQVKEGEIVAVPFMGEHGDLGHGKTGYVVRAGREQMLFAADSDCLDVRIYENIRKSLGRIQTVFLGMECVGAPLSWSCGPLFPKKPHHSYDLTRRYHGSNSEAGLRILETLGARRIYNYAMGQEPWIEYLLGLGLKEDSTQVAESNKLLNETRKRGFIAAQRLYGKSEFCLGPSPAEMGGTVTSRAKRHGEGRSPTPVIKPLPQRGQYPLSYGQQQAVLEAERRGDANQSLQAKVRLTGRLNVEALERSLNHLQGRHEVLRTRVVNRDGNFIGVIVPLESSRLAFFDLSTLALAEREAELSRIVRADSRAPFDLRRGPLLRVKLVRVAQDEHVLVVTLHHIVGDGWSLGVIVAELTSLYRALCQGQSAALPELSIQYADYAAWQREWMTGTVLQEQLGYWQEKLGGELPVLRLAVEGHGEEEGERRMAAVRMRLSAELSGQLKGLSEREGVTLFMVLLAGFKGLLYRYSGQSDIIVGTQQTQRREQTLDLVGPLSTLVALRTDLSDDPSYLLLLERVASAYEAAGEHQEASYEAVRQAVGEEQGKWRWPGFRMMCVLDELTPRHFEAAGLRLAIEEFCDNSVKYDLLLSVADEGAAISGSLEYDSDRFDAETIITMMEHYKILLNEVAVHPERPLQDVDLMSANMREYNQTLSGLDTPNDADEQFVF